MRDLITILKSKFNNISILDESKLCIEKLTNVEVIVG